MNTSSSDCRDFFCFFTLFLPLPCLQFRAAFDANSTSDVCVCVGINWRKDRMTMLNYEIRPIAVACLACTHVQGTASLPDKHQSIRVECFENRFSFVAIKAVYGRRNGSECCNGYIKCTCRILSPAFHRRRRRRRRLCRQNRLLARITTQKQREKRSKNTTAEFEFEYAQMNSRGRGCLSSHQMKSYSCEWRTHA